MIEFVGRKKELAELQDLFERGDARVAVIKGRRRVGKSALVEEFAKDKNFITISGIIPGPETTAQAEKDRFFKKVCDQLDLVFEPLSDWMDILQVLAKKMQEKYGNEPTVLFLDEISWMSSKDSSFIPLLKECWDRYLSKKSNFMLIFCGSISTWIEKNIIKSTAFYGRMSMIHTLHPLTIPAAARFLKYMKFKGELSDIYRILCVTGGVPFYLEQINPKLSAKDNIKALCFKENGLLVGEFDMIFHDLFNGEAMVHKKILEILSGGRKLFSVIKQEFGDISDEDLTKYLDNLYICGFVMQYGQYSLQTGNELVEKVYGLCDPYVNFYLRYIEPRRDKTRLREETDDDSKMAGFDGIIGLAVEMLLIRNNALIFKSVGASSSLDYVFGPHHQKATATRKACQIDFLIQDNEKHLYLCEFKFSSNPVDISVVEAVQEKMNRLDVPEGTAFFPVLFHIGGVTKEVKDSGFFFRIIDIAEFVKGEDD